MGKQLLFILLYLLLNIVYADNLHVLANADYAYSKNNTSKLQQLFKQNPKNFLIHYLYAKNMLQNKQQAKFAENYIVMYPNSYTTEDLYHQLLIFYFTNKDSNKFINIYNKLTKKQITNNETCGLDIININSNKKSLIDTEWLKNNASSPWCQQLTVLKVQKNQISQTDLNFLLFNLISNDSNNEYSYIATALNIKPINFNKLNILFENKNNPYILVNKISKLAKNNPIDALNLIKPINNKNLMDFLLNYDALQLALSQNYSYAITIFEQTAFDTKNDLELEWLAKSYMAQNNWKKVIKTINNMPERMKNKNLWIYWLAEANGYLNNQNKKEQILKQITTDYSYYSLLAQSELGQPVKFDTLKFTQNAKKKDIKGDFLLQSYKTALNIRSSNLLTVIALEWSQYARQVESSTLITLINNAYRNQLYNLGISAANALKVHNINYSFPKPYLNYYNQYSKNTRIKSHYSLAITRQESRFNSLAIASDGGLGLMQIMPKTAKYIFKTAKYKKCYLLNYNCNIKLGTWYLSNLYHKFGNYIYSSAGYNAGPNRAKIWEINHSKLDNILQIELIPIQITREYVQKVLTNKAIYDNYDNKHLFLANYINNIKNEPHNINILIDDNTDKK